MPPGRFPCTSAVILAASLAATSSAIDFGGENDISQTAGTVAPGGDVATGSGPGTFGGADQWTPTSNNVPTMAPTTGSGNQGWSQPTTTDLWTPTSSGSGDQGWGGPTSSGTEDQGWGTPTSSGTGDQGWPQTPSTGESSGYDDQTLGVDCSESNGGGWSPGADVSLECSGSDEEEPSMSTPTTDSSGGPPVADVSLECSGSDEEEPSVSTPTTDSLGESPTTTTAPTTTSEIGDQGASQQSSPTTSSPNTASSMTSGEYQDSSPTTTASLNSEPTTTTSETGGVEDSSQATQTSTTTTSSSATEPPAESSGTDQQETSTAQTSTNSTSNGEHATFGTITSKSGECVVGDPDTYITPKDLQWIWDNRMKTEVDPFNDWITDQLAANKGSINYCFRWDSDKKLTKEIAAKVQPMLARSHAAWNHWLIGYDCWPYDEIKVNVVGVAVKDASTLDFTDDTLGKIYVGDLDKDGSPQCPEVCYRAADGYDNKWSESSGCKGEPFDIFLWGKSNLDQGMAGWGTYTGQQVDLEILLKEMDDSPAETTTHEMGHGFGLPDFYQEPKPDNLKPSLMEAFTSEKITDVDGWMLRRVLENKKSNYKF